MITRARCAGALLLSCALTASAPAGAVGLVGKGKPVATKSADIALVRDGSWVAMTVAFDAAGPDDVALVVPLPAAPAYVARGDRAVLRELDRVSAPRVVELWEQDPCEIHSQLEPDAIDAPQAPAASLKAPKVLDKVKALAPAGAAKALADAGYDVPAGLGDALAKSAHVELVELPRGELEASAFTFVFEAADLAAPTRSLRATSPDAALRLWVLSTDARFEATTLENWSAPTNLDVAPAVLAAGPRFLAALEDKLSKKAVFTEYAWSAASCELCGGPLTPAVFAALGAQALPIAKGAAADIRVHAESLSPDDPDGPDTLRARIAKCYRGVLAQAPGLGGEVVLDVVAKRGVTTSSVKQGDGTLAACVTDAVALERFEAGGELRVELAAISPAAFSRAVLTRLASRAGAEGDLALRPAQALQGGRELGAGAANHALTDEANNFQARYVVRHPWKAATKCSAPKRGVWGGPPPGVTPDKPSAPEKLGDPKKLVSSPWPKKEALRIAYAPAPPPPPAPVEPDIDLAPPAASAAAAPPPAQEGGGGCACAVAPSRTAARDAWAGLAALGWVAGLGRRVGRRRRAG